MGLYQRIKNWAGSFWQPIAGNRSAMGPFGSFGAGGNVYGSQPEPTAVDLLAAYEDVVYACVNLISYNVQKTDLKLCATTSRYEPKPKAHTKALTNADRRLVEEKYKGYTRKAVNVEEVLDHPLLDLIDRPNPHYSFSKLLGMSQVYMELIGSAFWYLAMDDLGLVKEIWLLPSQNISIETDDSGHVTSYVNRHGENEERLSPDDVLHIRSFNPMDPYSGFGIPPVRAVWQRVQLLRQEQASWQAVLTNMAFPSALVSPPEGETFTPLQAERIAKQVTERFRYGNQGGVWVVNDSMVYTPVATPPKDLTALSMYDQIKQCVCNVYGVPRPMLDMEDASDSSAETARRSFQENCLAPRIDTILEAVNHRLCPSRLFLAAPNVVKPERTFELQRTTANFQGNITTLNEARQEQGYPPVQGGDKFMFQLQSIGTPSAQTFTSSFTAGTTKAMATKAYRSTTPDAGPLVKALTDIFQRQGQEVLARFKGTDAVHTKAFFPLADWTAEMARTLTPVLRAYYDEGSNAVLAELGGSPDVRRLAVLELDKAVAGATYQFAESTNQTTDLTIAEAVEATRRAIEAGLSLGEANAELTKRVQDIFTDLSERRAVLIAETESTRAKHSGELISARAAGVNAKKIWLCDALACDICRHLNGKAVDLDAKFVTIGSGPYADIEHPPGHPGCRCTLQYEFED